MIRTISFDPFPLVFIPLKAPATIAGRVSQVAQTQLDDSFPTASHDKVLPKAEASVLAREAPVPKADPLLHSKMRDQTIGTVAGDAIHHLNSPRGKDRVLATVEGPDTKKLSKPLQLSPSPDSNLKGREGGLVSVSESGSIPPPKSRSDTSVESGDYRRVERSPLTIHLAILSGNVSFLHLQKSKGADFNACNSQGFTPLTLAVRWKKSKMIKLLVNECGANIEKADEHLLTPLTTAVRCNDGERVKVLADLGADLEAPDEIGHTAATKAAKLGFVEVLSVLEELGADMEKPDQMGDSPITKAVVNQQKKIVETLLKFYVDINATDGNGFTPLTAAASKRKHQMVPFILGLGAEIDFPDERGFTALTTAVVEDDEAMVKILYNNEAKLNITDKEGKTALTYAAQLENRKMINYLFTLGADLYERNCDGTTAITSCVERELYGSLEVFASLNANFSELDGNDNTPLNIAYKMQNEEMTRKLVGWKANINGFGREEFLPLTIAFMEKNDRWIALYQELGASLEMHEEWLLQKRLGHAWGLNGTSYVLGPDGIEYPFHLGFFVGSATQEMLLESMSHFLQNNRDFTKDEKAELTELVTTVVIAEESMDREKLVKKVKAETPFLIISGIPSHAFCFGVRKGTLFYCNRGLGREVDFGVTFYEIGEDQDPEELVQAITKIYNNIEDLQAALSELKVKKKGGQTRQDQKSDTCCWVSLKSAIDAVFVLMQKKPELYKKFTFFTRQYFLDEYLKHSVQLCEEILNQVKQKIDGKRKRGKAVPPLI